MVVRDQNGFCSAHFSHRRCRYRGVVFRNASWHCRKINTEQAAMAQLTIDVEKAAMLLHDAINCRKAKSGSLPRLLGGEKRLEKSFERSEERRVGKEGRAR